MHKVIRKFQDKDGRIYDPEKSDIYPHKDAKKPSNARLKVLSSTDNKYNAVFIEKVEKADEVEKVDE